MTVGMSLLSKPLDLGARRHAWSLGDWPGHHTPGPIVVRWDIPFGVAFRCFSHGATFRVAPSRRSDACIAYRTDRIGD